MQQLSIDQINRIFADAEKKCIKACINTVNIQAATSRKEAVENIKKELTLRNTWTTRNIVYTQCPQSTSNINDIKSEVGATVKIPYMERQELGGIRKPESGSRLAIPSTMARGGNNAKKVKPSLILSSNKIVKGPFKKASTKKSQYVARAFVASKNNIFFSSNKTIFKITNFTKSGNKVHFKQIPIYNVKFAETKTPATPWLKPATDEQAKNAQSIYNYQMDKIFMGS